MTAKKYIVEVERVQRRKISVYCPGVEQAEAVALAAVQEGG